MHTPAHVAASLWVWRKHDSEWRTSALLVGAILPDAPMFLFFAVVKLAGYGSREIWQQLYFDASWQWFFDIFNSAPLFLGIAWWAWRRKHPWWLLMAGSALLHIACDFPLHHEDAHRHGLPLTQYRFESPISYWDPKHFGIPVAICEALLATTACAYLWATSTGRLVRWATGLILGLYALVALGTAVWLMRLAG